MSGKIIAALCAQALLAQLVFGTNAAGSATYTPTNTGYNYGGCGCGQGFTASGGSLAITSSSPIAPVGLSVDSENKIEGCLSSTGKLPFITAVAIEGQLPTNGEAATSYGCGGNVGIRPVSGYGGYGPGFRGYGVDAGIGYGAGLAEGPCCGGAY